MTELDLRETLQRHLDAVDVPPAPLGPVVAKGRRRHRRRRAVIGTAVTAVLAAVAASGAAAGGGGRRGPRRRHLGVRVAGRARLLPRRSRLRRPGGRAAPGRTDLPVRRCRLPRHRCRRHVVRRGLLRPRPADAPGRRRRRARSGGRSGRRPRRVPPDGQGGLGQSVGRLRDPARRSTTLTVRDLETGTDVASTTIDCGGCTEPDHRRPRRRGRLLAGRPTDPDVGHRHGPAG